MQSETPELLSDSSYFRNILETISKPLLVLDETLRVKLANHSFYEMFQVSAAETIDRCIYHLGNEQWNVPALKTLFEEILIQNTKFDNFEVEHDFPALGHRSMLLNARLILNPNKQSDSILVAIEDVTEIKAAAEKIRIFTEKLERSNRELQTFAQVASHDLQEPLRKIQAFGDRLKIKAGDSLNSENRDYLARMLNAASRMQSLINDLLMFSRIETKANPFESVDLNLIAQEVISDLEARIEELNGTIEVGQLPVIEADPLQMRQLLQNLIGNSLKYHREGVPPMIQIEAAAVQANEDAANSESVKINGFNIFVRDNGIGFDEKYLDRIFNVFQRLHGREAYGGTGVGLAICRKIAERHHGSITATSQPLQGSTFIVTLPAEQPSEGREKYGA